MRGEAFRLEGLWEACGDMVKGFSSLHALSQHAYLRTESTWRLAYKGMVKGFSSRHALSQHGVWPIKGGLAP